MANRDSADSVDSDGAVGTETGGTSGFDGGVESTDEAVRVHFDPAADAASMAVVDAVAEAASVDATDLPPIHSAIDPDALDALLSSATANDESCRLAFRYDGYDVSVFEHGVVTVVETPV